MHAHALAGQPVMILGDSIMWLSAALTAAGASLVADAATARYLIAGGEGVDEVLASCAQMPALEAVLLAGDARRLTLATELLPGHARYWAQRLAPRVRVNGLLWSTCDDAPAAVEVAGFLLVAAVFTTGLTLTL